METLQTADYIRTRCPNCQTVFEISNELAEGDDPRVRCGECYSIFNAAENRLQDVLPDELLVDAVESDSVSIPEDDSFFDNTDEKIFFEPDTELADAARENTDSDLFSADADLPEVEYLEENEEIPELDFNAIDPDGEQFDGTLFDDVNLDYEGYEALAEGTPVDEEANVWEPPEDNEEVAVAVQESVDDTTDLFEDSGDFRDVAPFDNQERNKESRGVGFGRFVMLSVLVLGLGGLYVYSNQSKLAQSDTTRPLVNVVCKIAGCEVEPLSNLKGFHVVRRNVYTHPTYADALVINIVFRNDAGFSQVYPNLSISMSDVRGDIVAERIFKPFEYLKRSQDSQIEEITSGQIVDISLEVRDPGEEAKSFELEFR